jgi:hypothetical protein
LGHLRGQGDAATSEGGPSDLKWGAFALPIFLREPFAQKVKKQLDAEIKLAFFGITWFVITMSRPSAI